MKNKVILKEITLINFKGITNKTVSFDQITNIFGDNGTGKTTIFDAFVWLFFGKDSTDRKDFQIKTLDKYNVAIPKIEHEVAAIVIIDGKEIIIRRTLKENWVNKRGFETPEFQGNETSYFWDGVPMMLKDFTIRVNGIMDEQVFKLITNPLAFNSMKWEDRRNVLIQITGGENLDELAKGNAAYEDLVKELNSGKTLAEYKKQVASTVSLSKENLKKIPTRIDEVNRNKPEAFDFPALHTLLDVKKVELTKIEEQISDKSSAFDSANSANNSKKTEASNLRYEIETIETVAKRDAKRQLTPDTTVLDGLKSTLRNKTGELNTAKNALQTLEAKGNSIISEIQSTTTKQDAKRAEWHTENAKELVFEDGSFCCPTCKRDFDESAKSEQMETMRTNFMAAKQNALQAINNQGAALKLEVEAQQNELNTINGRIESGKTIISDLEMEIENLNSSIETEAGKITEPEDIKENLVYESILSMDEGYKQKKAALEKVLSEIVDVPAVDTTALRAAKIDLQTSIDGIKDKLRNEEGIRKVVERVSELEEEERKLAAEIAGVEKLQFTIDSFNKLRIDTMERRVNSLFKLVSFKMFEQQINGGEKECCEALINGVPFSDANTASKINAGLDIINTLCTFYKVTAPIFIDNRESVVSLIETESQIINLIVSEDDKSLRVA